MLPSTSERTTGTVSPGGTALHEQKEEGAARCSLSAKQLSPKETRSPLPGTVPSDGLLRGVAHLTSVVSSTSTEWFVGHLALPGRLSSPERSFQSSPSIIATMDASVSGKGTILGTFEERCLYYTSPKMKYAFTDEKLLYRPAFIFKRST